jgi:anti-sigma factor RsiW
MECPEADRVQAYFDGELEAPAAAAIEQHLQGCGECSALLAQLQQMRSLLRERLPQVKAPQPLRAGIERALDAEDSAATKPRAAQGFTRARSFWIGLLSGVGGTAVAAAVGFLVLAPLLNNPLPGELLADHTRSLMAAHLIDVVSTDQHTVKPWFAGRIDISPVVSDFASQGYRLLGGRVDDLGRQKAAVVVYQHGRHVINVFSWSVGAVAVPRNTTRNGYHLAYWKMGDLGYCAVSDTGWSELNGLVSLLQQQGASEQTG